MHLCAAQIKTTSFPLNNIIVQNVVFNYNVKVTEEFLKILIIFISIKILIIIGSLTITTLYKRFHIKI